MIVDCDSCAARGPACGDCVVTSLLGLPTWWTTDGVEGEEAAALAVLADSGLVPPLRLVPVTPVRGKGSPAAGDRAAG